jgi:uncharacterized protein (DUF302 family)
MRYVVETDKPAQQAVEDLKAAVERHGFGVLHVHDLKSTFASKGFDFPSECQILEVCNPQQAIKVLSEDMGLNIALPCRISVYEEAGRTKIGMAKPTEMLEALSDSPVLKRIAQEVEQKTMQMIDDAK